MSKKDIPGPAIDPSDMANNQKTMFGTQSFNVQTEEKAAENSVKVQSNQYAVDTAVNQAFVKDAPDLPFRLPFHMEHLFGVHDADKEDQKKPT